MLGIFPTNDMHKALDVLSTYMEAFYISVIQTYQQSVHTEVFLGASTSKAGT